MRIIRDVEDDLWEETEPGKFTCRTLPDADTLVDRSSKYIESRFGPVVVFAPVDIDE